MLAGQSKITSWIQQSTGIENFTFEFEGTSGNEGIVGDLLFVKVIRSDREEILHLAIKTAKVDKAARQRLPILRDICVREVIFYDKVIPIFKKFQTEKTVREPFDAISKCYKAFLVDDVEIIVMENLKKECYELHPRPKPLNKQHILMVLKNYAKLHALSFALQDQKNDVFEEITKNYHLDAKNFFATFKPFYEVNCIKILNNLKEMGRNDLATKYERYIQNGIYKHFEDLLDDTPNERAIIHADCHSSNFLFKYEDNDKVTPFSMVIIDFQLSSLHSPMLDISSFLFYCLSTEGYENFNELLDSYYREFSSFLCELGSDPNKLFPKSIMLEHWKRYSGYGFFISSMFMEMLYADKETVPIVSDYESFMNIKVTSKERYLERLLPTMEYYLNFINI